MEFIKKIQHKLHDRMIRRQMAESKIVRNSVAFAEAAYIGILFNATELKDRQATLSYSEKLKQQGKKVKLLAYLNEKENQPNFTFDHFCNQDMNWFGKINAAVVDEFVPAKFDFLFCLNEDQPLVDIAARSAASLRVGPATEETFPFDLMIEKGKLNQEKFIEQIEFFIKKINHNQNV